MYKSLIIGILFVITNTYAIAGTVLSSKEEIEKYYAKVNKNFKTPKGEENKFYISYDTKKNKVMYVSSLDLDMKKQEKCVNQIFNKKEAKKIEEMAKGKTGIVQLIYYCGH